MITDSQNRLALISAGELAKLILLLQTGRITESRRVAAGIPDVATLRAELARREHAPGEGR